MKAGTHLVTAAFVDNAWEPDGVQQPPAVDFARGFDNGMTATRRSIR